MIVMSFNIHDGGGLPVETTAAAIRATGADIVGIQETRDETVEDTASAPSLAQDLAKALGWYVHEQWPPDGVSWEESGLWSNAIISRWPIGEPTPHDLGVTIDTPEGKVAVFNLHLDDTPYQPYQLMGIPYDDAPRLRSAKKAVLAADQTRGPALQRWRADLASVPSDLPAFVFGDFNEPSWRDWNGAAVEAGQQPLTVPFPSTRAIEARGFVDAYRAVFPDVVAKPAYTWTPATADDDPNDKHDRIDFVFVRGMSIQSAAIVGPDATYSDLVVTDWPSDHRACVAKVAPFTPFAPPPP